MLLGIDHLVIAVGDPDEAAVQLERNLGCEGLPGDGRPLQHHDPPAPLDPSPDRGDPRGCLDPIDPNGNLAVASDQLGRTTTFLYTKLNLLGKIDYSDAGTSDVTIKYNVDDNRTLLGNGVDTTTYTYDELDRLTRATTSGPKTVDYRYDLDGNRTGLSIQMARS